jgi:hypothetical protein
MDGEGIRGSRSMLASFLRSSRILVLQNRIEYTGFGRDPCDQMAREDNLPDRRSAA